MHLVRCVRVSQYVITHYACAGKTHTVSSHVTHCTLLWLSLYSILRATYLRMLRKAGYNTLINTLSRSSYVFFVLIGLQSLLRITI